MFSGIGYDKMAAIADVGGIDEHVVTKVFAKRETRTLSDCKGIERYLSAIGKRKGNLYD